MGNELKNTTKIVKEILQSDERARNSDSFLYLRVLSHFEKEQRKDIGQMPIALFLINMGKLGIPPFETVRRTRQKIQRQFPELAGCSRVEIGRAIREEEFREFARSIEV